MNNTLPVNKNTKDIKVDLHIHTTASDGTWTPSILIDNLLSSGIKLFALTDHNTTGNITETAKIAKANDLMFIPGVEINATYKNRTYHILGLGIDANNDELHQLLNRNRALLTDLDNDSIKLLEKRYPSISSEEFKFYNNPSVRGGWRALNYIIDKGLCTSYKDYSPLFKNSSISIDNLEFSSPKEVINTICAAGGFPILAHPGAEFYDKDYKAIVAAMIEAGVKGIECFHPNNSQEITDYCLNACKENNLLITGGSDCHGDFVVSRCLGHPSINLSQLRLDGITVLE
jgi:3',5'-nucleoside bisphosphate phosphatase